MEADVIRENTMILAQDHYYELDSYKTQLNNNVLVVGTSGAGKTRSIVSPNILQAAGSYLIVDPKGNLYGKYSQYLKARGYKVRKLNFAQPDDPKTCRYNLFQYIRSDQDVLKVAHMLTKSSDVGAWHYAGDPFWDDAGELLLVALIAYLRHSCKREDCTLESVLKLVQMCHINEDDTEKPALDYLFEELGERAPDDFAYRSYQKFRQAAGRTMRSILITVSSKLAVFDTEELRRLFSRDTVDLHGIGMEKTTLFVVVSDTDRSMDPMANVFFSQAIQELCRVADALPGQRLPIDVRFLLDDFATNVRIVDFPRMIASIRSRGISVMLMIQAESQLMQAYGEDGRTIIGNCDTYVYLGGNDVDTARSVAQRANLPLHRILYMPIGTNWIFRRGQEPVSAKNFDLDAFVLEMIARKPKLRQSLRQPQRPRNECAQENIEKMRACGR